MPSPYTQHLSVRGAAGPPPRSRDTDIKRLLPALVRIQARRDDTRSLARLAGEAGLSARHFHRLFCRLVGETPRHYCERLRLDHAAFCLRVLRSTILELALDCGFRNHETFSRAFRRQFGTTPRDYRRSGLLEAVPAAGLQGVGELQQGYELSPTVVREVQAVPVGFVRHVGPYEAMSVDCWTRLQAWARARGWGEEAPLFGIAHDAPGITPPARLRFDAAMRVPRAFTSDGEIGFQTIGAGHFGITTHVGPHATLAAAYREVFGRLRALRRYTPAGFPCVEAYHTTQLNAYYELNQTDLWIPMTAR